MTVWAQIPAIGLCVAITKSRHSTVWPLTTTPGGSAANVAASLCSYTGRPARRPRARARPRRRADESAPDP